MTKYQPIPASFQLKKQKITESLSIPQTEYTDKSPKGSVDHQITDLINEINSQEGWVTTSSCAGRVSVFAEGEKTANTNEESIDTFTELDNGQDPRRGHLSNSNQKASNARAGPGGKGYGGHWLYVSHDPVPMTGESINDEMYFTKLFGLQSKNTDSPTPSNSKGDQQGPKIASNPSTLRAIRLSFSPLILHVHVATLHHARPLLSAAINAGFRESGVQTLKALEDPEAGTMVAIRTAGLAFETIIGCIRTTDEQEEVIDSWVGEDYLRACVGIINERFTWNDVRREKLRDELRKMTKVDDLSGGVEESKTERRERKRVEGLRIRQEKQNSQPKKEIEVDETSQDHQDVLDEEFILNLI